MTPGDYARAGKGVTMDFGFHTCPFGIALVLMTDKGVCGLGFGDEGEDAEMLADMRARWPKASYRENASRSAKIVGQIFDTDRRGDLPLHLMGTPWQLKVWEALLSIPSGRLVTYRAIAEKVESPKASRAVGTAVGRNPISWLIPCHRVLGSNGALTGYHWGVARKRAMRTYRNTFRVALARLGDRAALAGAAAWAQATLSRRARRRPGERPPASMRPGFRTNCVCR